MQVRFLPDAKALGVVVHKVARSHRAFPIRDLARLFLDNPQSCEVRFDVREGNDLRFHQCSRCGWIGLQESDLRAHAFAEHFAEHFDVEEIEGEPPTGSFVCVARCGLTGKLLAPPNHHSFNQRIQEVLRAECKHLSEEAYRATLETVHDPDLVEQWRQEARKRTIYRAKTPPDPALETGNPALERGEAERLFSTEILPKLITTPKHAACRHDVAMALPDPLLSRAVHEAWRREQRYPASLFFALRGAFRHKRMHVFRAGDGRGIDFVMSRPPTPLDVTHAIPELRAIVDHLTLHPGATRAELLQGIGVSTGEEQPPGQDFVLQQLAWITERGHVIEYFNGVLALPEDRPVFRTVAPTRHETHPHRPPPASHPQAPQRKQPEPPEPPKPAADASPEPPKPPEPAADASPASVEPDDAERS